MLTCKRPGRGPDGRGAQNFPIQQRRKDSLSAATFQGGRSPGATFLRSIFNDDGHFLGLEVVRA